MTHQPSYLEKLPEIALRVAAGQLKLEFSIGELALALNLQVEDPGLLQLLQISLPIRDTAAEVSGYNAKASAVLLKNSPQCYGIDLESGTRRAITLDNDTLVGFSCQSGIEGHLLFRSMMARILPQPLVSLHGAVVQIQRRYERNRNVTVAFLGAAGSGKSHLITQFLRDAEFQTVILEEDWAIINAHTTEIFSHHQPNVLLKKATAALYAGKVVAPIYLDCTDARRAIYPAVKLYDIAQRDCVSRLDAAIILRSETGDVGSIRPIAQSDYEWIRHGEYSPYYQSSEQLLDGSTETFTPDEIDRRLSSMMALSLQIPIWVVENSRQTDGKAALMSVLQGFV